uniref:Uncharacterized protein n=1 Tax=Oryza meridionalis TaxID=40149 RepID=A0A0E0F632_9ORYZ
MGEPINVSPNEVILGKGTDTKNAMKMSIKHATSGSAPVARASRCRRRGWRGWGELVEGGGGGSL